MVKIYLYNFRCHLDKEIVFEDNSISLLQGNSGCGKSTILNAIYWCLYGSLQNVYNNVLGQVKMYVKLEIDDMIIYRQKQPNLFKITLNDQILEDTDAQYFIENRYGNNQVWLASCYVQQNVRSLLLSLSSNDKLKLLNQIAFDDELDKSPIQIVKNIEQEYLLCNKELEILDANFKKDLKKFNSESKKFSLKDKLTDEENLVIKEKISDLDQQKLKLQEKNKILISNLGKKDVLEEKIKKIKKNNLSYVSFKDQESELNTIKTNISKLDDQIKSLNLEISDNQNQITTNQSKLDQLVNNYQAQLRKQQQDYQNYLDNKKLLEDNTNLLNKINQEIKEIDEYISDNSDLTDEYLQELLIETKNHESSITKNKQKCQNLKIQYTQESIDNKLSELKNILEQNKQKILQKEENQQLINKLSIELEEYKFKLKFLKPEFLELSEKHDKITKKINNSQDEIVQIQNQVDETKLNLAKFSDLNQDQLDQYYFDLDNLKKSLDLILCPDCQSKLIFKDNQLIKSELSLVNSETAQAEIFELETKISDHLTKINQKNYLENQVKSLESELISKQDSLTNYQNQEAELKSKIQNLEIEINQIEQQIYPINLEIENLYCISTDTLSNFDITKLESDIKTLEKIKVIDQDVNTSDDIQSLINYRKKFQDLTNQKTNLEKLKDVYSKHNLTDEVEKPKVVKIEESQDYLELNKIILDLQQQIGLLNSKFSEINSELESLKSNKKELKSEIKKIKINNAEVEQRKQDLAELESELSLLEIDLTLENKLEYTLIEIENLHIKIEKHKLLTEKLKEQTKILEQKDELNRLKNKVNNLIILKKKAVETEYNILSDIVNTLNNLIDSSLNVIFDDPIKVTVLLYKTTKNNKSTKPNINLKIDYKGSTFDNINQVSGGEATRISLAISLALARINSFPLLILDEPLSSLDNDSRNSCLENLKNMLGQDKTIIVVNHEVIEAHFDKIISL